MWRDAFPMSDHHFPGEKPWFRWTFPQNSAGFVAVPLLIPNLSAATHPGGSHWGQRWQRERLLRSFLQVIDHEAVTLDVSGIAVRISTSHLADRRSERFAQDLFVEKPSWLLKA